MAKIEVDTLTDNCWQNCEDFYIETTNIFGDGKTYCRIHKCKNVNKCRRIAEVIDGELKWIGGDSE